MTLTDLLTQRGTWANAPEPLAPFEPPPVRVVVGKRQCLARVRHTEVDGADVTMTADQITPWRRAYLPGQARPRRNRVVRHA